MFAEHGTSHVQSALQSLSWRKPDRHFSLKQLDIHRVKDIHRVNLREKDDYPWWCGPSTSSSIWASLEGPTERSALMATVDQLNDRYGRGAIGMASTGQSSVQRIWMMKQSLKTPDYTTRWEDVPRALA